MMEPVVHQWETDLYPARVLGRVVFSLCGCQTPAQHWIKILHPWVQEFYPVLGLGSGDIVLEHFQTPTLFRAATLQKCGSEIIPRFSLPKVS